MGARSVIIVFAAALLAVAVPPVHGQELGPGGEAARDAFDRGVELFNAEQFEQAVASFREAYGRKPSWKILYNIGQCEAALKRYGLALEAFETYLVEGGDDVAPDRVGLVRDEIARLRDISGELRVTAPNGSVVLIDGVERGETPLLGTIRVAAGRHRLVVQRNVEVLLEREFKISGQGLVEIAVGDEEPVDDGAGEEGPPTPAAAEDGPSPLFVAGWITAGVGAAVAIAGGVTGGMALSRKGELESACPGQTCDSPGAYEKKDEAQTLALATDILLPVGAVLVVGGVVMVLLGRGGDDEEAAEVSVMPLAGPDGLGLAVGRRF